MNPIFESLKIPTALFCLLFSLVVSAQDISIQHIQDDVPNNGKSNTDFVPVSNLNRAFVIPTNNRKTHGGIIESTSNMDADDMSGATRLASTSSIQFSRISSSLNEDARFNASIIEYIGPSGGPNEFMVRERLVVNLNESTNSVDQIINGVVNKDKCIPFITGILNTSTDEGADSSTALAFLNSDSSITVRKGSNANNVTVYITLVEFTGSNWTVLHGSSGDTGSRTGNITLRNGSDGTTGAPTPVSSWSNAAIFGQHIGDTNANGLNNAIADNWPLFEPNGNSTVEWEFDSDHDSNGNNLQFVHVLSNSDNNSMRVARGNENDNNADAITDIDIFGFGAQITDLNQALIVGSSISSGGGTAYARGWRNYYFNSNTEIAAWCHRDGNSLKHSIQILDFASLRNEIDVVGNNVSIPDGDSTPQFVDNTDFGTSIVAGTAQRVFEIKNDGNLPLNLTSITLSNTTDFSIISAPALPRDINGLSSQSFTVRFNAPTSSGTSSSTVTIRSNDTDEDPYTFDIVARTVDFFDNDNDGIPDNRDGDDDNDGILDGEECGFVSASAPTSLSSGTGSIGDVDEVDFNFTVPPGNNRIVILILAAEYKPGVGNDGLSENATVTINDASDNVLVTMNQIGIRHGEKRPRNVNDDNNYLAVYILTEAELATLPNATTLKLKIEAIGVPQAWAGHIETLTDVDQNITVTGIDPDVEFFPISPNDRVLSWTSPSIPIDDNEMALIFANSGDGGSTYEFDQGSEIAEIDTNGSTIGGARFYPSTSGLYTFTGTINKTRRSFGALLRFSSFGDPACVDTDGDGVQNSFDLDADNDGIPDVVEAGFASTSGGRGFIQSFNDNDDDGIHNPIEGQSPIDSDGDGTPNYLDLDSDNDTRFDVDESGVGNSASPSFQNGDGDIDGDGVGDGPDDAESFRQRKAPDGTIINFGDGILDIFDFNEGGSYAGGYGNSSPGNAPLYLADSDNDGTPDYIDTSSDGSNFDISTTIYADLDTNGNGRINGMADNDEDGILDAFDTDDENRGSPRLIDDRLLVFFDGRNDYIEDTAILNGQGEVTMMGWIKVDASQSNGSTYIMGQEDFHLRAIVNGATFRIDASANGSNVSSGSNPEFLLPKGQWVHVAVSYSVSKDFLRLFINGEPVANITSSNSITDTSNFTMGKRAGNDSNYFRGFMDEIRLFNKALSDNEIQKMVYQEIENNNGNIRGTEVPLNITDFIDVNSVTTLSWNSLIRYFRLDTYRGDITDDLTTASIDTGTGAKMYNIKTLDYQTAPMPFVTQQSGNLNAALSISEDGVNGQDAIDYDYSIVRVEHGDVTFNGNQRHVALFVNELDAASNPIEYSITNDSELNVSWYLNLDGFIDLEGESQLIQGPDSELKVSSGGRIERDQQGTADTYTYNYWSSPVGSVSTTSNNTNYTLANTLMDGTNPANPLSINFVTGRDGSSGSPISISSRWLYQYKNRPNNDFSQWNAINENSIISAGEGFTMKGPGTGDITDPQNYVFVGKPNNGNIALPLTANHNYLIGNPYPSAIDAVQFILDNSATIDGEPSFDGTLYFWEHFGGGSHIQAEYQGGYATYNLSGGTPSAFIATSAPGIDQTGSGTEEPGRYIPVSQGFFVNGAANGNINFNNDQRIFKKEAPPADDSVFFKNSQNSIANNKTQGGESQKSADWDKRMKIRIGFTSSTGIHRQLLLTIDENATMKQDWGYDGALNEDQANDMYWMIDEKKFVIQGSDNIHAEAVYPLGLNLNTEGLNTIRIDDLEHVPNDFELYIHDRTTNIFYDIREAEFQFQLPSGTYPDRFALTFSNSTDDTLNTDELIAESIDVFYSLSEKKIGVLNPKGLIIERIELYNLMGQKITTLTDIKTQPFSQYEIKNLKSGAYIINLLSEKGTFSKKIVVN